MSNGLLPTYLVHEFVLSAYEIGDYFYTSVSTVSTLQNYFKGIRGPCKNFFVFPRPRSRFQGMNSASLCSLAGRYDNPIPPRFLAPIDSLKIPALKEAQSQLASYPFGERFRSPNRKSGGCRLESPCADQKWKTLGVQLTFCII
jgi:hypothetical protein